MRIGLISHQWPGARMGGIGSYVRQCAVALAAAGHEAHVFTLTLPDDARELIPPGVVVHETPDLATRVQQGVLPASLAASISSGGEGLYRLGLAWLLCSAAMEVHRRQPLDILEAPEVEGLGLPLMLMGDRDLPVVTHLHCCTAIAHHAHETDGGPSGQLVRALEFAAIQTADAVCAPTQYVVDVTRRFVSIDRTVRVIPHPFTCPDGPFSPPPDDGPILFIGRVERLKGCAVLAEALNRFLSAHPTARFRFVGPDTNTGPHGGSMVEHIRRTLRPELAPRVEFAGERTRDEIDRELRACRFVVLPSLWENFSMACCEAMAAGRAVIVGDGTGLLEVVGDSGLIAERGSPDSLAEQMGVLFADQPALEQLSLRAYERVRTHCAPTGVVARRVEFYQDTIAHFRDGQLRAPERDTLPLARDLTVLTALSELVGTLAGVHADSSTTPGARLLRIMNQLREQTGRPTGVVLYGAGKHTARLLAERIVWENAGHRVVGLIDDHPRFRASPVYLDLPVQSVAQAVVAAASGRLAPTVVLSTDTYGDQFWLQTAPLREGGVSVFRLYG